MSRPSATVRPFDQPVEMGSRQVECFVSERQTNDILPNCQDGKLTRTCRSATVPCDRRRPSAALRRHEGARQLALLISTKYAESAPGCAAQSVHRELLEQTRQHRLGAIDAQVVLVDVEVVRIVVLGAGVLPAQ